MLIIVVLFLEMDNVEKSGNKSSSSSNVSPSSKSSDILRARKRKAASTKKRKTKRQRTDDAILFLTEQVSEIKEYISGTLLSTNDNCVGNNCENDNICVTNDGVNECISDVSDCVSRDLYLDENNEHVKQASSCAFDLNLNTALKEPSIPKSLPAHVELLKKLQHFDSDDWSNVRYAEVQKNYCYAPGFTYLESNDELKPYDKNNSLALIERGFACITLALIKQNESAQNGFKTLLEWANIEQSITPKLLQEKIYEIFVKGSFQKISNDLFQLTCGHRAELIQQRRDILLRSVKDSFVKASLRKIPPSSDNLFAKELFSSVVEKTGPAKVFWPPRVSSITKAAAQAQHSQQTRAQPSYAYNYRNSNRLPTPTNLSAAPGQNFTNNNTAWRAQTYPRPAFRPPRQQANSRPSYPRPARNFRGQEQYPGTNQGPRFPNQTTIRPQGRRRF